MPQRWKSGCQQHNVAARRGRDDAPGQAQTPVWYGQRGLGASAQTASGGLCGGGPQSASSRITRCFESNHILVRVEVRPASSRTTVQREPSHPPFPCHRQLLCIAQAPPEHDSRPGKWRQRGLTADRQYSAMRTLRVCLRCLSMLYLRNTPGPHELLPRPSTAQSICRKVASSSCNWSS